MRYQEEKSRFCHKRSYQAFPEAKAKQEQLEAERRKRRLAEGNLDSWSTG